MLDASRQLSSTVPRSVADGAPLRYAMMVLVISSAHCRIALSGLRISWLVMSMKFSLLALQFDGPLVGGAASGSPRPISAARYR